MCIHIVVSFHFIKRINFLFISHSKKNIKLSSAYNEKLLSIFCLLHCLLLFLFLILLFFCVCSNARIEFIYSFQFVFHCDIITKHKISQRENSFKNVIYGFIAILEAKYAHTKNEINWRVLLGMETCWYGNFTKHNYLIFLNQPLPFSIQILVLYPALFCSTHIQAQNSMMINLR